MIAAPLRAADARGLVWIVSGAFDPERITLFSIFRDEMFFAPAFFAHYRSIGVEQFLILDDRSTDGTGAYLAAQPDAVTLASDLRYGEGVAYAGHTGRVEAIRAGVYFKMTLPGAFAPGRATLYVDADEFLFLPPGVPTIRDVLDRMRERDHACIVASIVEFFPETLSSAPAEAPGTLAGLLDACGWFEPEPLVEIDGEGRPHAVGVSKSTRLFARYGLRKKQRGLWRSLKGRLAPEYRRSPQFKTPIVRHDGATFLTGTHACNRPAPASPMLTIAHFVFTSQMRAKVGRALDWRAHTGNADKYEYYHALVARLAEPGATMLGPGSRRFASVDQFVDAGLMRWQGAAHTGSV